MRLAAWAQQAAHPETKVRFRTFLSMGLYRICELDHADLINGLYSVECGSDASALRAARTLLERSAKVEVWKNEDCVAQLSEEAKRLWPQLRDDWISSC